MNPYRHYVSVASFRASEGAACPPELPRPDEKRFVRNDTPESVAAVPTIKLIDETLVFLNLFPPIMTSNLRTVESYSHAIRSMSVAESVACRIVGSSAS